jgi:hypothetical protein
MPIRSIEEVDEVDSEGLLRVRRAVASLPVASSLGRSEGGQQDRQRRLPTGRANAAPKLTTAVLG